MHPPEADKAAVKELLLDHRGEPLTITERIQALRVHFSWTNL